MRRPPTPFWMTRSRREGVLSSKVEFWTVLPERERFDDGDAEWFAPTAFVDIPDAVTYVGSLDVSAAIALVGRGVPETDAECVRVGPDLPA